MTLVSRRMRPTRSIGEAVSSSGQVTVGGQIGPFSNLAHSPPPGYPK